MDAEGSQGGERIVDRLGSGRAALIGGLISIVGTIPFTVITADMSYWFLGVTMAVRGFGVRACAVPAIIAAYCAISPSKIQETTVQLNVGQRIGGAAGTAIFAVILQNQLEKAAGPTDQTAGFGTTFCWVVAVGATAPALLLTAAERPDRSRTPRHPVRPRYRRPSPDTALTT
ncbi:hypothetical protein [Protofrankia symbiont of Coriaria ruscifolia]|uniref:hypothetical protein n=1 Tax=Protofrankia symbiont of Coriaria ruscifolia TaxID=1306542 RepID=UPI0010411A9B|nr:hypothetical protein [Protofrankia symbiont of Coriaria ruscifolia]